jgi:hypothetical protein
MRQFQIAVLTLGLFLTFEVASAQNQSLPPIGDASSPGHGQTDPDSAAANPRLIESLASARNVERQKELVTDTQKLFLLAQQLRDEVAKSNKDELSVDVVKKSAEIEKLAKSVKDKMRGY